MTHPIPQALLAKELAENWAKVQKWLSRQRYSEDEVHVSDRYERAIKGINFAIHRAKKSYLEATTDCFKKLIFLDFIQRFILIRFLGQLTGRKE